VVWRLLSCQKWPPATIFFASSQARKNARLGAFASGSKDTTMPAVPSTYFTNLQQLANEQDKAQFASLAQALAPAVARLPLIKAEIKAMLQSQEQLDWQLLLQRVEPQLNAAAKLLEDIDFLPEHPRQQAKIEAFANKLSLKLTLHSAPNAAARLQDCLNQIKAQEQAEKEQPAKEQAEKDKAEKKQQAAQARAKRLQRAVPQCTLVPGGEFMMGCAADSNAQPVHQVKVPEFRLGTYPVTVAQYRDYCDDTQTTQPYNLDEIDPQMPVVHVSFNDIKGYLLWLSQLTGQNWRLPSESEWEYAARAGTTTDYWWGNKAGAEYANYSDSGVGTTTQVGSYPANPWGLCDMNGNVWEWCQDYYIGNYHATPCDGSAYERGGNARVLRGGCWANFNYFMRSTLRNYRNDFHDNYIGFRVVCGALFVDH
jgi:formylglycine-generating enzyme required for sulfatase activity